MHYRVCRDCGEEYRPEIARCADCGGELENRYEDEAGTVPPPPPPAPPAPKGPDLTDHLPLFVSGDAAGLVPLAERLQESGIAFHLLSAPLESGAPNFTLVVHRDDHGRALGIVAPLVAGEAEGGLLQAVDAEFDAAGGYRRCPACGTELVSRSPACPECGLVVAAEAAPCPRCAGPVAPGEARCPGCGLEVGG